MALRVIPYLFNPATRIGFQVVVTPKGERLEKVLADQHGKLVQVKVVERRKDRKFSAAIHNRTHSHMPACDTEGAF